MARLNKKRKFRLNIKSRKMNNLWSYHSLSKNYKHTTFFFYNKKMQITSKFRFKRPGNYQHWEYFYSRLFGLNKNMKNYLVSFYGYHNDMLFTNLDEYFFFNFKIFLRNYSDYFSLSWFLTFLRQRDVLLPLLRKGIRFLRKLPCRGQRTTSNYETSKKRSKLPSYLSFKRKLTSTYVSKFYPGWQHIESFYFHRF